MIFFNGIEEKKIVLVKISLIQLNNIVKNNIKFMLFIFIRSRSFKQIFRDFIHLVLWCVNIVNISPLRSKVADFFTAALQMEKSREGEDYIGETVGIPLDFPIS